MRIVWSWRSTVLSQRLPAIRPRKPLAKHRVCLNQNVTMRIFTTRCGRPSSALENGREKYGTDVRMVRYIPSGLRSPPSKERMASPPTMSAYISTSQNKSRQKKKSITWPTMTNLQGYPTEHCFMTACNRLWLMYIAIIILRPCWCWILTTSNSLMMNWAMSGVIRHLSM